MDIKIKRTIGVNELGRRVGESHHNAILRDHEVDLLLQMHGEGWGYRRLAGKFEVSKRLVRDIVHGRRRGQVATAWKTIWLFVDD